MTALSQITAWLLLAIEAWAAVPRQPNADEIHERVAEAIVAVAYDQAEPPVYQGDYGRARTALLLASIAGLETRYLERVITGHCVPGECDNGHAFGMLQQHVGRFGVRLVGGRAALCFVAASDCYSAMELVDDLTLQVRVGLHVYRTQGVRAYTPGLKAQAQANLWIVAHAPPATDVEVMSP